MSTVGFMLLFLGALASGFVAGLAGFGTALLALGIWLYVLPPSIAVPLVFICSVVAQTSTLPSLWRSFDLRLVWPFLIGGLAGVPLGTMLVAHADPGIFKLSVGILLLVFPPALYFNKPMALSFGGRVADAASDLPAESLAASPVCPACFQRCGPACGAGARMSGAGFFRSSTGPYWQPLCACRREPALSELKWFGSHCWSCRQRYSAPGSAGEPIAC